MKRFAFWIFLGVVTLMIIAFGCKEEDDRMLTGQCGTPATVRLMNEGGCGYVFDLEDGTHLVAYWEWGWCGTPPLPQGAMEDPLYNFEYVDGKKVSIAYEELVESMNSCQNGKIVKITCLEEWPTNTEK